jgi:hypothetical protein
MSRKTKVRQEHILMVPFDENRFLVSFAPQIDEIRNDSARVGSPIHIIAQKHKSISRSQRKSLNKGGQFFQAAMNVTDDVTLHDRLSTQLNGTLLSQAVQGILLNLAYVSIACQV